MTKKVWNSIGYNNIRLKLKTDSTAAKGIASRKGVGKVKHLRLKGLWVQDYIQRNKFTIEKESTVTNWSDLNTKSLSGPRITELLSYMPIKGGLQAACLLSCRMIVGAQDADDEDIETSSEGMLSFFFNILWNILAIYGMLTLICTRLYQSRRKARHQRNQTENDLLPRVISQGETVETVYVIGKGAKFHKKECVYPAGSGLKSRTTQMYRKQAVQEGLTACKACMSESSSG